MNTCVTSIPQFDKAPQPCYIHPGMQDDQKRPRRSDGAMLASFLAMIAKAADVLIHTRMTCMAFRMTGIAPAAAMMTLFAAFPTRFIKAAQAVLIPKSMAGR